MNKWIDDWIARLEEAMDIQSERIFVNTKCTYPRNIIFIQQ